VLELSMEYGASGTGQIRTRVQAFLEMLEARSGR
jgi:benzoyl-CoA reductase/2-hydroxyglutaryl-CoA dehydratase subunit BcrC/BadD/HgdB